MEVEHLNKLVSFIKINKVHYDDPYIKSELEKFITITRELITRSKDLKYLGYKV